MITKFDSICFRIRRAKDDFPARKPDNIQGIHFLPEILE